MKYKYIISNTTNPYDNLAMEQELFHAAEKGYTILFLWQNQNTIVVGKNQDVSVECREEEFVKNGGLIARRKSGGGAVYHDLGNLNFSLICYHSDLQYVNYMNIIRKALHTFSIEAIFNGRNDLMVENRKFSGNAVYSDGNIICQHGTLLIQTDIEKMNYYLTPAKSKLSRNSVKSVASRVLNLSEISNEITISSLKDTLINVTQAVDLLWKPNRDIIHQYRDFFSDKQWIYGGRE